MTERETLKLALKALEEAWYHVGTFQPTEKAIDLYDEARAAIKEALAQPKIITGNILMDSYNAMQSMKVEGPRHVVCQCDKCKAQPEQKPMHPQLKAMLEEYFDKCFSESAPQRTWVSPTEKEIEAIWQVAMFADYGVGAELSNQPFVHYARAIEAKLKEKNT